ncbi:cobalamin-binding protein [Pacificoceanicola onchidii]|uniref:cobalamin-binding protein n=1 Tax=Pacificoceanicola onchidii TaxID=2562685 RepID=UPI0010A381BB|nr:cobalamin-binding protein [Pacificoceanicola onchidii]
MKGPKRIVCLTAETVETLYMLGQEDRIAGVTGYAVRPPRVRREKPRVGAFTSADTAKILALEPDLVLTFSDLQADIAADLIRAGIEVHAFNQRDVAGILRMIETLGQLTGASAEATEFLDSFEARCATLAVQTPARRPKVWFEEWDTPLISGIGWVSDLIHKAGGTDIFADLAYCPNATDRIVTETQVAEKAPDLILASWCGKKIAPERIKSRPGWDRIPAVQSNRIHEIKAPFILAPGPAALTDGLDQIAMHIAAAAQS